MIRSIGVMTVAVLLASCASKAPVPDAQPAHTQPTVAAEAAPAVDMAARLEAAANGAHRSPENIARNAARHPVETLTFFGIEPTMTVVEVWPGGGWYTEVIGPALDGGQLVAANFAADPDPEHYRTKLRAKLDKRIAEEPVFANVRHGTLAPGGTIDIGAPGSADLAVSFRNMHSFINAGVAPEIFAAVFDVLKPGGVFGVVQHRADEGVDVAESAKKGYVPESYVIELATAAGFELVEKSEINANPNDTKDHPEGVWTLPPSYRLGDVDRAKYEAIGESDRMTLKFRKP